MLFVFLLQVHPHFVPLVLLHGACESLLLVFLAKLLILLFVVDFLLYPLNEQFIDLLFPFLVQLLPHFFVLNLFVPLHFFVSDFLKGRVLLLFFPLIVNSQLLSMQLDVSLFIQIIVILLLLFFFKLLIQFVFDLLLQFILPSLLQFLLLLK